LRGIITARSARDQKPPKAKYKDRQRAGLHSVLLRLLADAVRSMGRLFIAGTPVLGQNGRVISPRPPVILKAAEPSASPPLGEKKRRSATKQSAAILGAQTNRTPEGHTNPFNQT